MSEERQLAVYEAPKQELVRPIATPKDVMAAHQELVALCQQTLQEGVDTMVIPGTGKKPSLMKAGAERLNMAFNAFPDYETVEAEVDHDRINKIVKEEWDWSGGSTMVNGKKRPKNPPKLTETESQGLYRFRVRCTIKNRATGQVMAVGEGVCSTMESKYISRPRDCENTVLKMAQKRAYVGATLNAYGLSDRFTQDIEDMSQFSKAKTPPEDVYEEEPAPERTASEASIAAQAPLKDKVYWKGVTNWVAKDLKVTPDEYKWIDGKCKELGVNILEKLEEARDKHEIKAKGHLLQYFDNECVWPLPEEGVIEAEVVEDEAKPAVAVQPAPEEVDPFEEDE